MRALYAKWEKMNEIVRQRKCSQVLQKKRLFLVQKHRILFDDVTETPYAPIVEPILSSSSLNESNEKNVLHIFDLFQRTQ